MYFELKNDILRDFGLEPKQARRGTLSQEEPRFDTGKPIDISRIKSPKVFITNGGKDDPQIHFLTTYEDDLVMSAHMLSIFEKAGVHNFQKVEAIIESTKDNTVWDSYYVVNIIGLVACIDFEKSDYQKTAWGTYYFDQLAINPEKIKDELLFRPEESPDIIIMHKSVGKMIKENDPDETLKWWDVAQIIQ